MAKSYMLRTTNGEEVKRSKEEMIDTVRGWFKYLGREDEPTRDECISKIDEFLKRYRLVVSE